MPIIESIISQHAEEVAFLWLLRDVAVGAPHYSLKDLADLDARAAAHIDGLRLAGDEGWPFCEQGLDHQESGEVFAAAVIALEGDDRRRIDQVVAAVEAVPETARGLVSAICWITPDKLQGKVAGLLGSASPLWRRVGIAACAVHRVDCGKHLTEAIEDPDPRLRARALRAVGETARRDLLSALRAQIGSEVPECAFWAACSALLLSVGSQILGGITCQRHPLSPDTQIGHAAAAQGGSFGVSASKSGYCPFRDPCPRIPPARVVGLNQFFLFWHAYWGPPAIRAQLMFQKTD